MYRVVIVEDDPMVASINRQYVELNKHLKVVGQFSNGKDALTYFDDHQVDLLILDLYMPVMDGRELLQILRSRGKSTDVIMVTAANETAQIQQLLALGVLDYLVKPFEYIRFNQALAKFMQHQDMLQGTDTVSQQQLDHLLFAATAPATQDELLQKGLQGKTLETILSYMKAHKSQSMTSDTIASDVGLSRVTVRRYMNYLLEKHEVFSDIDYSTGGRPSIMYRYLK